MLATTPASTPNWCTPVSKRAGPVALGATDIDANVSMTAGSRNTVAPIGGPPQATALTATTSASTSLMSIRRYGAADEWSTTTRPPTSWTSFVTARRESVTVPSVDDADVIATRRVTFVTKLSHCHGGRSTVDVDLGPLDPGTVTVCCTQPRRDVCLVVETGHHHFVAEAGPRRRGVRERSQQHRAVGAEHHATGVRVNEIGHGLAGCLRRRSTAPGRWVRTSRVGREPRKAVDTVVATESGTSIPS